MNYKVNYLTRLYMFMWDHVTNQWTDAWPPILRPWIRSAEVLGECRYGNGTTTTTVANQFSVLLGLNFFLARLDKVGDGVGIGGGVSKMLKFLC